MRYVENVENVEKVEIDTSPELWKTVEKTARLNI
jgi:hypothetical protein